jgi:hydroxymethylglutaryl-CoA reductase
MITEWAGLTEADQAALDGTGGLNLEQAGQMIENAIGLYALPIGVATNFLINGEDYLIPMVTEEASVVAAASNAARLVREGGGFKTESDEPIMIGQIQVMDTSNVYAAAGRVWDIREELIHLANDPTSSIVKRGGGVRDIDLRPFPTTDAGPMLIVHILMDTRDAMGANAVNTVCESIAPRIAEVTGGRTNLRILSNLTDRRRARASCVIPEAALGSRETVSGIVEASIFAETDPYRAATGNKGVMNGIDAVCLATGNDWRAVEAGAHAFAAKDGHYRSFTRWRADAQGNLHGSIDIPLAVGTVGGVTRVHPIAQLALKILGYPNAQTLAGIIAAVGLAQNLGALRALATDGIQKGHMRMHARNVAMAAGALPEEAQIIADQMVADAIIKVEHAAQILAVRHENQGSPAD